MKILRTIACVSAALMLVSGCASDTETDSPTDTVTASDTGASADTAGSADTGAPADAGSETAWEAPCADDSDCAAPTDWCAKMPGEVDGYCTIHCANGNADCTFEDWTCNAAGGCDNPEFTWCGPPEEIENGGGFLVECE